MSKASAARVIALAVALTAVSMTMASAAGAPASPTTVDIQRVSAENNDRSILTYGTLSSSSRKCVANRNVEIYFDTDPAEGPFTKVDTARTSDSGEWAGIADTNSIAASRSSP